MLELDVAIFFLLYLGAGFFLIFGLWFFYDWRDAKISSNQRQKVIFHCIKCSQVYTGKPGSEESNCPNCGFKNGRLRF